MEFVSDKLLTATMLYPTGGEEAIRVAMKVLNKEEFKKENTLRTTVVDSTNVLLMQLQANKITSQQESIQRQSQPIRREERTPEEMKEIKPPRSTNSGRNRGDMQLTLGGAMFQPPSAHPSPLASTSSAPIGSDFTGRSALEPAKALRCSSRQPPSVSRTR